MADQRSEPGTVVERRGSTLLDKLWDRHVVWSEPDGPDLLYVDLHLVHDLGVPAFEELSSRKLPVRRPDLTLATEDHVVPSGLALADAPRAPSDPGALRRSCSEHGITLYGQGHARQGIVHVIGPELGITQPGMSIVCGDSHTSTHGAFGALAFGIGASESTHVLATQTIYQHRLGRMAVHVEGTLRPGATAKDLALEVVSTVGTTGAASYSLEYQGSAVRALSMEGRMTICNMAIEAGARSALVAPDDVTFAYVEGRPFAPTGRRWEEALERWTALRSDPDARFDAEITIDARDIDPRVTWGTNPAQTVPLSGAVPAPDDVEDPAVRDAVSRALDYMGLEPGVPMSSVPVDVVFIGSCTNSRIEDLRAAAAVVAGRRVHRRVRAVVVPGSSAVKHQAESEGLDRTFRAAGFDWGDPGCSMCIAVNGDRLEPGQRCASTSNRNFEGRQGPGGRTHLVSPAVAAATAIAGSFARPDDLGAA